MRCYKVSTLEQAVFSNVARSWLSNKTFIYPDRTDSCFYYDYTPSDPISHFVSRCRGIAYMMTVVVVVPVITIMTILKLTLLVNIRLPSKKLSLVYWQ